MTSMTLPFPHMFLPSAPSPIPCSSVSPYRVACPPRTHTILRSFPSAILVAFESSHISSSLIPVCFVLLIAVLLYSVMLCYTRIVLLLINSISFISSHFWDVLKGILVDGWGVYLFFLSLGFYEGHLL
ncbi:hypothetical protein M422DRAFT_66177 [Sphaerobolus stellatus SS14]|nr:hypothetical protein M422DRAFT_66177 [Sphaerobolus stellatus SS14]